VILLFAVLAGLVLVQAIALGQLRWLLRLLLKGIPILVGWVVIIVALDWVAGTAWNEVTGQTTALPNERSRAIDLIGKDLPPTTDPRVDSPAYDGVPWVEDYFAELDALRYGYLPYLGPRINDVRGRYFNSTEGIRRSYQPTVPDAVEPIEVWFFGGSTTWGEGQRDLHTIPSEVARLAESHGVFIRAVNMGERGYTAFQEFLLFQQRIDELGPPDLAVFFDGHNEFGTRNEDRTPPVDQPVVFQREALAQAYARAPSLPWITGPLVEPSIRRDYVETSLLHKLLRGLDLVEPAAAAQEEPPFEPLTAEETLGVFAVYERSVLLNRELAARSGVAIEQFWQPTGRGAEGADFADVLPDGVHDIHDAFASGPPDDLIFIDGGHSNELGARLSAEAMWPHLAPTLRRLAADR
jgi:hypothetical protein